MDAYVKIKNAQLVFVFLQLEECSFYHVGFVRTFSRTLDDVYFKHYGAYLLHDYKAPRFVHTAAGNIFCYSISYTSTFQIIPTVNQTTNM